MHKITLPFSWTSKSDSIAVFSFPVDLEKLNSLEIEPSEFPCFYIDLKDGNILGVSEEISSGKAYRYINSSSYLVEGKNWWIGYNESEDEEYLTASDDEIKKVITQNNFNNIVDSVCEYARKNNLGNLNCDNLYVKFINNEDAPYL